jgi:hypothetical protein
MRSMIAARGVVSVCLTVVTTVLRRDYETLRLALLQTHWPRIGGQHA